jgi:hypothetical protein
LPVAVVRSPISHPAAYAQIGLMTVRLFARFGEWKQKDQSNSSSYALGREIAFIACSTGE